jgi:oxygen-dependent protoporphyrinogen oxidase
MVTGVYGGDARRLSLRATFPKMWKMEREHRSLFRAMLRKRKEARASGARSGGPAGPGGRLTSFRDGLEELIGALARALGSALRVGSPAVLLSAHGPAGYRVHLADGEALAADAVVLALPSWSASRLVESLDPPMSKALAEIPSAPMLVAHLGFDQEAIGGPPAGFGFLVPRDEGVRILGTIWTSSVFPGRAPPGKVLLTCMLGGAHDPPALALDDAQALLEIRGDLRRTMGLTAEPIFRRIFRHEKGIPQYTLGHAARLATVDAHLEAHPGLQVAGNCYRGISVNHCVEEAPAIAERVVAHFETGERR